MRSASPFGFVSGLATTGSFLFPAIALGIMITRVGFKDGNASVHCFCHYGQIHRRLAIKEIEWNFSESVFEFGSF